MYVVLSALLGWPLTGPLARFQLYAVLLSLVTVGNKRRWSKTTARHLNVLLLTFVGVYIYRDIFPLATFDRSPTDIGEGWLLYAKLSVLAIIAVVIPLGIPRQYIPVNPKVFP